MRSFLVNRDCDVLRLEQATFELNKAQITFERYRSILGLSNGILNTNQYCAMLNHCDIIFWAQLNDFPEVAIFEDDVIFRPNFKMSDVSLPDDYDLFYLYDWYGPQATTQTIARIKGTPAAHAYIVHSRFYQKYLDSIFGTRKTHDRCFDWILNDCQAVKYALTPNVAGQREGLSTITNSICSERWG